MGFHVMSTRDTDELRVANSRHRRHRLWRTAEDQQEARQTAAHTWVTGSVGDCLFRAYRDNCAPARPHRRLPGSHFPDRVYKELPDMALGRHA